MTYKEAETARDATYHAVHFHGGYGFVLEHDAQLFYRRARGWPRVWGDPTAAYRRVAAARQRIERELSFEVRMRAVERIYEELAGHRSDRTSSLTARHPPRPTVRVRRGS